jgi:hypothetical protein
MRMAANKRLLPDTSLAACGSCALGCAPAYGWCSLCRLTHGAGGATITVRAQRRAIPAGTRCASGTWCALTHYRRATAPGEYIMGAAAAQAPARGAC